VGPVPLQLITHLDHAGGGSRPGVSLPPRSRLGKLADGDTDGLRDLAGTLAGTGAEISTIAADASDPDGLGARMRELYLGNGAPGVIVYNAVMGAPDRLLSSSAAHLQAAYSVDVIGAIVVAQVAAPAMRGRCGPAVTGAVQPMLPAAGLPIRP
jgi:NAD(P)-dependent dehydrogenase (short-subunit alcohol dehydrogenase family)